MQSKPLEHPPSVKTSLENLHDLPDMAEMDRFVKVTEAARILGFASFQSIYQMIARDELNAYRIPNHNRQRILLSDLIELRNSANSKNNLDLHNNPLKSKKGKGRPRKYS
tara:strand:+ start:308 stop:637 length:330 start_codon:yes stop_codon:yes gene_type:complete